VIKACALGLDNLCSHRAGEPTVPADCVLSGTSSLLVRCGAKRKIPVLMEEAVPGFYAVPAAKIPGIAVSIRRLTSNAPFAPGLQTKPSVAPGFPG
jgi:hypothetical protein